MTVSTVISATEAEARAREAGVDVPRLMTMLLPEAAKFAKPPVSNFRVGCVSRGLSGALYFGTNLEFAGEALSFTVHAEQSSVTSAWMHGEEGIDLIAVNAPPCGYCRQFLNELATADRLIVAMPNETRALRELLPSAFGPSDLGIDGGLMQRSDQKLVIDESDELAREALKAANMSYAPYSKSYAGVAVKTSRGIYAGAYAENAAFNPSMSPLQVALSRLNLAGESWDAIEDAVLVHTDSMHTEATRVVLRAISGVQPRGIQARAQR
ncbi:MAG TPA: cytidine deaminase [Thermoanaerobaculia bacterium]|nr:cytidine deaminase [Thermoanaerobaculia bacterium]